MNDVTESSSDSESESERDLREAPTFELEHLVDDETDPSELTVFAPATDALTTEWLTVDRTDAVPLDRVR
ncbi:hypothetical protein ACFQE1_11570 [Halobium palmae]|uniref:Uncharacterized protein n=1 Tax=Halobium palmae TaxID=1776492 RepID=A0ABD5S0B6_9EURY